METVMAAISVSVSAMISGSGKFAGLAVEILVLAVVRGLQDIVGRPSRLGGPRAWGWWSFSRFLVAADAPFAIFSMATSKARWAVAAQTLRGQLLAGRERHGAVHLEGMALAAHDHVGAAAVAIEIFADGGGKLRRRPASGRASPNVDMFCR